MKKTVMTLATLLMATSVLAQVPSRVAVVDVNKILSESKAGQAAYATLQSVQEQHVQRLQQMEEEVKALEADYSQKKLSLAQDRLDELERSISEKRVALQRYGQDAERDLQTRRNQTLKSLNDKIMPIVDEIGKEMGFAMIFNKFEAGLVYASDAVDVTDVVVKRVNEKVPAQ